MRLAARALEKQLVALPQTDCAALGNIRGGTMKRSGMVGSSEARRPTGKGPASARKRDLQPESSGGKSTDRKRSDRRNGNKKEGSLWAALVEVW